MAIFDEKIFQLNRTRIRIELAKLDRPQSWLADQVGVSRQLWHIYWKAGRLKYLEQTSKILGVPTNELVTPRL